MKLIDRFKFVKFDTHLHTFTHKKFISTYQQESQSYRLDIACLLLLSLSRHPFAAPPMNVSAPEFKPSGSINPAPRAPPLGSVEPGFRSMMKENSTDVFSVSKKSSSVMKPGAENVLKGNFAPPTAAMKQLSVAAKKDDRQRKGRGAERRKGPERRDNNGKGNSRSKQSEPRRKNKGGDRKKGPPEERAKAKPSQQRKKEGNKGSSRGEGNKGSSREEKRPSRISKGKGAIKRNTESFEPNYDAPDVRVVVALPTAKLNRPYSVHDIVMVPQLACEQADMSMYDELVKEVQSIGRTDLFVSWHGDTHFIADDKKMGGKWKDRCPTFLKIVERMRTYFDMDIKATRLNWYKDSAQWKPFHFDAAGVKPKFAKTQNCTVAISIGAERECAFEHAASGAIVSVPQPNGCCYAFGRDVNLEFRHGVLPQKKFEKKGRISIIAWGWVKQTAEGTVSTACLPPFLFSLSSPDTPQLTNHCNVQLFFFSARKTTKFSRRLLLIGQGAGVPGTATKEINEVDRTFSKHTLFGFSFPPLPVVSPFFDSFAANTRNAKNKTTSNQPKNQEPIV